MNVRRLTTAFVPIALALGFGWWSRGFFVPPGPVGEQAGSRSVADTPCPDGAEPDYWRAPMDRTYIRDKPGKSPMGMDLVPVCPGEGAEVPAGIVRIDPGTVQNIGVRTVRVETRDLSRNIRAVGRVAYDERRVAHVHSKVQGWVEKLLIDYVGQEVVRGEPLLEIYSPELVATQEELLLAARYRRVTRDSPFADVSEGGEALFNAARRRMELWDIPDRDIDRLLRTGEIQKSLTLYAPSSGVVTKLGVRVGMEVGPNQNLYTIADLTTVWVLADVYEFELPWVEVGQQGTVELSYLPGLQLSGPVTYVAPFLDPKTRTAQVRLELTNPDGRLKPEMFGNMIIAAQPRRDVVAIPTEAVIRSGRRSLVAVALGEGRFEPREVTLGLNSGDGWVEVTDSLDPGEEIVVSSQFLIDSESKLQEAVRKLLQTSSDAGSPRTGQGTAREEPPMEHSHGLEE